MDQYQQQHHNQDLEHIHNNNNDQLDTELADHDIENDVDHDLDVDIDYEAETYYCTDNNPPDSYAVCHTKVADWLDRNTYMERKASVKFACGKNMDRNRATGCRRPVSLNQRPKLSIIGFRKKPVHQTDKSNSKHNERLENVRLFMRTRSEPGRDYCLLITEPVSPRVSCVGRVGSVRVQGRKAGVWRSFKAAFSNLVQTNRVGKIAAA
ncbi:hypothetical protein QVD17_32350 [Tagetes erecta]|uniref:Uncharacterized protein n=1 Tax=Tagetes erecta TaxID=13708 RepID=A0AAD8K547_TARER|nr:hypothetical protein QVD17_32350 [Tagetes erecta]